MKFWTMAKKTAYDISDSCFWLLIIALCCNVTVAFWILLCMYLFWALLVFVAYPIGITYNGSKLEKLLSMDVIGLMLGDNHGKQNPPFGKM